ncbi:hypothetical protein ABZ504_19265, partial [Streptomyces mirabilis]
MHRTTTAATLLVTMATATLSGCVTVQRPPAPTLPTAPMRPVVQIPLDAPQVRRGRVDHDPPVRLQLDHP